MSKANLLAFGLDSAEFAVAITSAFSNSAVESARVMSSSQKG
jgi:hypothetical protein